MAVLVTVSCVPEKKKETETSPQSVHLVSVSLTANHRVPHGSRTGYTKVGFFTFFSKKDKQGKHWRPEVAFVPSPFFYI